MSSAILRTLRLAVEELREREVERTPTPRRLVVVRDGDPVPKASDGEGLLRVVLVRPDPAKVAELAAQMETWRGFAVPEEHAPAAEDAPARSEPAAPPPPVRRSPVSCAEPVELMGAVYFPLDPR